VLGDQVDKGKREVESREVVIGLGCVGGQRRSTDVEAGRSAAAVVEQDLGDARGLFQRSEVPGVGE
jgi:RNase adaptor protein for sRNA GlmZ degradation